MDIKLIAECGPARGQALAVHGKLFVGRDPHCQVRPQVESLAGIHALIESRQDQAFVRDCSDSIIGTRVNDRVLHSTEVAVFDGDTIAIGDAVFSLCIKPRDALLDQSVSQVPEGWPFVLATTESPEPAAEKRISVIRIFDAQEAVEGSLTFESPQPGSVLVVRLKSDDLNDELTIAPLRSDLQSLSEMDLPHRVVIDLEEVSYVSSRAVGVILAYYQRLIRDGGSLRVCRANKNVQPVLRQMRLDHLIDVFDTFDEAMKAEWE